MSASEDEGEAFRSAWQDFYLSDALSDAGSRSEFSVPQALVARELGARRWSRQNARLRSTFATLQPWLLAPEVYSDVLRGLNKAFCAAWLGEDTILVGTKCNALVQLSAPASGPASARRVPLPPKPAARLGPPVSHNPDGHCGIHAVDVSPDGRLVVTGGAAAEDAVVFRAHGDALEPLRTYSGHADWIFGLAWVTDRHFASCSRDGTIKLWSVEEPPPEGGYDPEPAAAVVSVLDSKRKPVKQRDLRCCVQTGTLLSLGVDGTVAAWDASLRQSRKVMLEGAQELVCLGLGAPGALAVAGSKAHLHLLDFRARRINAGLVPAARSGVRSVRVAGHVLSAGTGDAQLAFYDLRYLKSVSGPRLRDIGDPMEAFLAARGLQPLEVGRLDMPPSNAPFVAVPWGSVVRDAVYTHCWDPSGTRLFMAGGPLVIGVSGCSMSLWV